MVGLDLDGALDGLALLVHAGDCLRTHDTTTPVAARVLVLVGVALLDGREELGELGLVLLADVGDREDSRGLSSQLCASRANKSISIPSCGRQSRDGPCP